MRFCNTIKFRFAITFLLALCTGSAVLSQGPTITITASPASVLPFEKITFTVTVKSGQRVKAAMVDPIPLDTSFVSVQHSGANSASDKCYDQAFNPFTSIIPGVPPTRNSVFCLTPFPGTETITVVVTAINPGIVTNTAALVWETNAQPPSVSYERASASVVVLQPPVVPIFRNFVLSPPCTIGAPGACVSTNSISVNGDMPTFEPPPFPAFTWAVSFSPPASLKLADIEIPFGFFPGGPNIFNVWITGDNNGSPGNVLENFTVLTFPNGLTLQTPPITVIPSVNHPPMIAGKQYWLVMGPGAATSYGAWNLSLSDPSTATNFLVSGTTTVGVMPLPPSQWIPATADMQNIRVAFEIDGFL